jgi:hypothetical protein
MPNVRQWRKVSWAFVIVNVAFLAWISSPGVSVDIVVSSLTSFEDGEIDHAVDRARQTPPAYLDL